MPLRTPRQIILLGCLLLLAVSSKAFGYAREQPSDRIIHLTSKDRVLILAPHPDDEVLGCGGIIQEAVSMGVPLRVVFLTYGDNSELSFLLQTKHPVLIPRAVRGMGEFRHAEALAAAKILGVSTQQLIFLGYPDWGTFLIWCKHWGERPPYRSMLTRVNAVPYADAFWPGAAYKGEEIVKDIENIVRSFRPTKVFVSHPADRQPDHRACYLFARVALWNAEPSVRAECFPYLIHYRNWLRPIRNPINSVLRPPRSLRYIAWSIHPLSAEEAKKKLEAVKAHKSQYRLGPKVFPLLVRSNELFGDFATARLYPKAPPVGLWRRRPKPSLEAPEELMQEEQAAFVGPEWRSMQIEGENLVLSFAFSRPLAREVAVSVYVFGYRKDRPFEQMPKLHMRIGVLHYGVYDQNHRLPSGSVQVSRSNKQITLRVPLKLLGNPHRVLTTAQAYLADVALDELSCRTLELAP